LNRLDYSEDLEANIVAGAIAAFQYNNMTRSRPINDMIIPCISFFYARPKFYKVPLTKELSDAVEKGESLASTTIVERCDVIDENIPEDWTISMELPRFRQLALQYFAAFHTLTWASAPK
jgi:hypothetical protein